MSVSRNVQNGVKPETSASSPGPTSTTSDSPKGLLCYITAPWQQILNSIVPVGYEDEAGFHFGEETVKD